MAPNLRFRYSPAKDGVVKVLGPLETEIMQVIWHDKCSTVKKVHRALSQNREIAYTTVMTTMSRLADKGVLNRQRDGLAYIYDPALSEEDFVTMVVQQVLDGLLTDYSDTAVDYMIDFLVRNNPKELKRLRTVIDSHIA